MGLSSTSCFSGRRTRTVEKAPRRRTDTTADMDYIMPLLLLSALSCSSEPLTSALQRRSHSGVYAREFSRDYEPYSYVAIPLNKPIPVVHVLSKSPLNGLESVHHTTIHPAPPPRPTSPPYGTKIYASSMSHQTYAKPSWNTKTSSWPAKPNQENTKYEWRNTPDWRTKQSYDWRVNHHEYRPSAPSWHHNEEYPVPAPDWRGPRPSWQSQRPEWPSVPRPNWQAPRPNYPVQQADYSNQQPDYPVAYPEEYSRPAEPSSAPIILLADEPDENKPVVLYARPNDNGGYSYRKKPSKKRPPTKEKEPLIIRVHKYRHVKD